MSSPEKSETLAAHPPAVKAGGMRIVQDKSHLKKKNETPVPKPEDGDALKVSNSPPKHVELMSGATPNTRADFPQAAVDSFHVKPLPTVNNRGSNKPTVIQQPKK